MMMKRGLKRMRIFTLLVMLLTGTLPLSVFGGEVQHIDGEISALKVLEAMYGKLTNKDGTPNEPAIWHNIGVPDDFKRYWKEKDGEVYIAFEARYKESGVEKYIMVTQTRPYGDATYMCHACAPLVGCVVFTKSGNRWAMESQNKYIGVIGKWGWLNRQTVDRLRDTVELIKAGPEKYGVAIRGNDVHQGYVNYYIYLIVPYKDVLRVSLSAGVEGAGPGACSDLAARNRQGVNLVIDKDGEGEYYGLTLARQWNKGPCRKVKSVKETKKYRFADGVYTETGTAQQ